MLNHKVLRTVRGMSYSQRLALLRDVVQNMAERNDGEEIARFVTSQLGGDDEAVVASYAGRA